MKKSETPARKHGARARAAANAERLKTVLTFESGAQAYHWTTDRGRSRLVIKH
jgi:hypothetical protein